MDQAVQRAQVLATIRDDLAGSYDADGVTKWFTRPRHALGGRSPDDILTGDWDPADPDVEKVVALARELRGPM